MRLLQRLSAHNVKTSKRVRIPALLCGTQLRINHSGENIDSSFPPLMG